MIDPLAPFCRAENVSRSMFGTLLPLADLLRRHLIALSRHPQTPRSLTLELNEQATDYLRVPEHQVDPFFAHWGRIRMVLEDAPKKLTRQAILEDWPPDFPVPSLASLWVWLDRAVQLGLVACEGAGRRSDPFRYWLPQCEADWRSKDPLYDMYEKERQIVSVPAHKFDVDEAARQITRLHQEFGYTQIDMNRAPGEPAVPPPEEE